MNIHTKNETLDPGLEKVRRPIDQASHAPGFVYSSPEVYRREIDEYFKKDWLYVGREEELAKPGDYMSLRLVDEPIVISRGRDGKLNAFFNMCVHRGVEVAYGNGNTRAFKCPYHGWIYDLEGKLTGATHMKESCGFDAATSRMRQIRVDTWRGNIFICFSAKTRPLVEFLSEFEKEYGFLHMEKCRLGNKIHMELECNWKLVFENLMDFYHVNVLHANTFGGKFSWTDEGIRLKSGSELSIFYDAAPPTPGGKPLLGKMPWMQDRDYSFGCHGYATPNFTLFGRIDCVRPIIVWPVSEKSCYLTIYHLFPEEFFSRPDFKDILKVYEDYQLTVLNEDRTMIESMQKAMANPDYEPGRMSTLEKPLHHYLNGYVSRLFGGHGAA